MHHNLNRNNSMNRKISFMMLYLLTSLCIISCGKSETNPNVLKVGLSADYPPFAFKHNGKLQGLDIDLIEALGQKIHASVIFKEMDFHAILPALTTGRIDLGISGITASEERKQNVNFSDTYFESIYSIITHKNSSIKSIAHLPGLKLGAQLGSTMEKFAKTLHNVKILAHNTNPTLLQELKLCRIDGVITEYMQAIEFCKVNSKLTYHVIGSTDEGYAMAFPKNSPWQAKITTALNELKQCHQIDILTQKWIVG